MELAPADVPLSFEVTFDANDLHVGMSVYDDTGLTPILVAGPSAMTLVADYTYRGKFTAADGRNYIIIKAVYTDDTFSTLNPNYSQGSESIVAQVIGGGGNSSPPDGAIVGFVIPNDIVIGLISNDTVLGFISC
jgi:hypothetical protein